MSASILILCTGNATRSVIAGAVLKAHLPDVEIVTAGTLSIDGLPMSWRTRAGFESVGLAPPAHRSRQVAGADLDRATIIIGLAPEHVEWVRREHPTAAGRTATLKRLARQLADDGRPLAARVAALDLAGATLGGWEEVVDPGGGEVEAFIACAEEVVTLVDSVADRLRPPSPPFEPWTGERAQRWIRNAAEIERQLAAVSDVVFATADLQRGERVLDVGCGAGPTTRRAADLVGATGTDVGVDIAAAMLDAARAEPSTPGSAAVEWLEADVVTWDPGERRFDAVISRFGVMFFTDPVAAFATLRRATAPGGRLCVAVWAPRPDSPFFQVPLDAALTELARTGDRPAVPPPDIGPFSLGDPESAVAVLTRAGWADAAWGRHRLPLPLGGGAGPDEAAALAVELGPTRLIVAELTDDRRAEVTGAIAHRFADHLDAAGKVVLDGTIGIVLARATVTPSA